MTKRNFPNWLDAYMEYANHSESPDLFHLWTGVSVIAGALRRQAWIEQGYFQWTPNFYIIFVAPPGIVSKSTTISIGTRLLRQIQGIHFGPEAVTWQSLVQSLAAAREMVPMPDGQFHTMSCVTIVSSELGTFLNPKDREMVTVLTRLWDGQIENFTKETKTQGNDTVQNPWVNIIGCTTPSWFADNVPMQMASGGFLSRCVLIYGDTKRRLIAYPVDALPAGFKELEQKLLQDLEAISIIRGPYELDAGARAWGTDWYAAHYDHVSKVAIPETLQGYMARKQTHMHKLAIILAAARRDERVIRKEDLIQAEKMLTPLEAQMQQVFSAIGTSVGAQLSGRLMTVLRRYKRIQQRVLYQQLFQQMSYLEFRQAMESALASGQAKLTLEGNEAWVTLQESK